MIHRCPSGAALGEPGGGFVALMRNLPRERVAIGVFALAYPVGQGE